MKTKPSSIHNLASQAHDDAIVAVVAAAKVVAVHREDESVDLLGLSSLQASWGVAEYRKVRFTWPGQRSILYAVLQLYYCNVPEE